ncbi:hypothetical protein FO519_010175, partial [Halicephalobus sp. NKZ332]
TLYALINANIEINTTDEDQYTPLHIAAKTGNFEAAKALIEKDSRLINTVDRYHWYPIHIAVASGKCDIISLLLDKGADVDAKGRYNDDDPSITPSVTVLQFAAKGGHIECVRTLVMKGADINHQDHYGRTALHGAAKDGNYEIAKFLVENGANASLKTNNGNTALDLAAKSSEKNEELIQYLTSHSRNPIHHAVRIKNTEMLNALIAANIEVNTTDEDQWTPLHIAAKNGNLEAAEVLIEKDFRLINTTDINHWYPIHQAAFNGKCDIVSLLLGKGADVNVKARYVDDEPLVSPSVTALQWAAEKGHIRCLRILVRKGADINHQDHYGNTALHKAVKFGNYKVAKFLVENGTNTSLKTNNGNTALDLAAKSDEKNNEFIRYLANNSKNPVHCAVRINSTQILNALIAANVNVYTKNKNQYTPLHIAAKTGNFQAAEVLIEKDSRLINTTD